MMYVHGFMSGANGAKQRQLQDEFKGQYRVIAPELDGDPDKSLNIINETIRTEKPSVIVGSSLGGWMATMCDSKDAKIIIVNPCTKPEEELARWLNEPQTYFCKRLDGVQTYLLTDTILNKYKKYDFDRKVLENKERIYALCSEYDELLGTRHIERLKPLLPENHLLIKDDFGHQCKDMGLHHLYNLIQFAISGVNQSYIDFYINFYKDTYGLTPAETANIRETGATISDVLILRKNIKVATDGNQAKFYPDQS